MNIEMINKESEIAIAVKYDAVDFTNMSGIMGEVYGKLQAYLAQNGKQMMGAPYCKYTNGSADSMKFDIELGIPVSEPLPEQEEIFMAKTCAGKAITAMHKGAYKDIDQNPARRRIIKRSGSGGAILWEVKCSPPCSAHRKNMTQCMRRRICSH